MIIAQFPFIYATVNAIGVLAHVLCALGLILFAWRKHAKASAATTWPTWKPWRYFGKTERCRFNPITMTMCYGVAMGVLAVSLRWVDFMFNRAVIRGEVRHFPGSTAFAGGVLVFFAVILILSPFFSGNGKPLRQLQLFMPGLALHHAFNRTACLLASCCYGVPHRFGIVFPDISVPSIVYAPGTRVFPSQAIEAGVMLLLFGALLWLQLCGKRHLPIFPLVFGLTGFLLGFMRSPTLEPLPPMFGWLYPTPLAHLMVFWVGIALLVLMLLHKHWLDNPAPPPCGIEPKSA